MERRQDFSENANAVHLLVRGFPRVSSAPSGSTKPWRIPQSCATRSQQIAYLGESNCGWRNPLDSSDIGHVFVQEQQFFASGKFPLRCVSVCNSDTNIFDADFNDCFWMLRDSNMKSDKELMKFSLCIATHVVFQDTIPSTAEPLQVHRFTFENHSYVGCTTDKANHTQGHPWCQLVAASMGSRCAKMMFYLFNDRCNEIMYIYLYFWTLISYCKLEIEYNHLTNMPNNCD